MSLTGEDRVEVVQPTAPESVVLGPGGPPGIALGVPAGADPALPERRQPLTDIGLDERVGVRAGGVVQRDRLPVGEVHRADRHAQIGARSLDIRLVPCRCTCVLGHLTYSLRRHYPVPGSAVDAAVSVPRCFT